MEYSKKNMIKQQESIVLLQSSAGKSFEKNYILHGYYIFVFTMKARFVKILTIIFPYSYADFVESRLVALLC